MVCARSKCKYNWILRDRSRRPPREPSSDAFRFAERHSGQGGDSADGWMKGLTMRITSRSQNVECPIMLAHALDDLSITSTHSRTLFNRLLEGAPGHSVSSLALGAHATLRTSSRPELRLRQEDGRSPRVFHLETVSGVSWVPIWTSF